MTMSLGPYASFIVTSYAAAAIVVTILIGWIMFDYRNQTARLRELDRSGITRRSGRSATDTPRTIT
jgi:heme exporter protein D